MTRYIFKKRKDLEIDKKLFLLILFRFKKLRHINNPEIKTAECLQKLKSLPGWDSITIKEQFFAVCICVFSEEMKTMTNDPYLASDEVVWTLSQPIITQILTAVFKEIPWDIMGLGMNVSKENIEFIEAAKKGDLTMVQLAISDGADINALDRCGMSAIAWSVVNGHMEVIKVLLEQGANVNEKHVENGATVLMFASAKGYVKVVEYLVERGADVNMENNEGETALWHASQEGYTDIVECLLQNGARVDAKKKSGATPLWIAAEEGHVNIIKNLLKKGADINVKLSNSGETALWIASQNGHEDVAEYLIEEGADIDAKTTRGDTALMKAVMKGHIEVVRLLLEKGADVNVKVISGNVEWSALKLAKNEKHAEIIQLLLNAGAKD